MASIDHNSRPAAGLPATPEPTAAPPDGRAKRRVDWKLMLGQKDNHRNPQSGDTSDTEPTDKKPPKWSMGILNDRETDEVPGSVLLLSKVSEYNEPLGLRNAPARTSASSIHSPYRSSSMTSSFHRRRSIPEKKRTADGKIVLEPQPDDSANDPLNWEVWRRDAALFSLGFYCMLGGGMTPILAAGFNNVAEDYNITESRVALTTGLYMLGLGLGSILLSPTAILFGKRIVYLVAAVCFILSGVWCALSPNFPSLICARIFMGFAVASVECLPSATIAEIYFLHEKGYRLGIYTLLLLGGKNLVPLVSAAIIQSLGWRWVFWIVAIIVAFGLVLLFFFVPETTWDRTPRPRVSRQHQHRSFSQQLFRTFTHSQPASPAVERKGQPPAQGEIHPAKPAERHAHFQTETPEDEKPDKYNEDEKVENGSTEKNTSEKPPRGDSIAVVDYFTHNDVESQSPPMKGISRTATDQSEDEDPRNAYTRHLEGQPKQRYLQQLAPYSGRLSRDKWLKAAIRPFILFAYPNILWSTLVYSLSIGWLIVLSESVTSIYKSRDTYNFTSLQAGLVYISPFVGGILGTAVAGKVSDIMVRWLARKNGGVYEPEFRLIMALPIALTTVIGLMGYGWSAEERDAWIVPTVFFGIISFGCSLGSTTSITFAVDSYRQYAGEALVTLNFSKNVLHGLVFSLFFNNWLDSDGSKDVFIAIGCIQLACLLTTIPVYIWGKRSRMWTVRKNLMEKF